MGHHHTPSFHSSPQLRHLERLCSDCDRRANVVDLRRLTVSCVVLTTELGAQEPANQELGTLRDRLHRDFLWTYDCLLWMRSCMRSSTLLEHLLTSSALAEKRHQTRRPQPNMGQSPSRRLLHPGDPDRSALHPRNVLPPQEHVPSRRRPENHSAGYAPAHLRQHLHHLPRL